MIIRNACARVSEFVGEELQTHDMRIGWGPIALSGFGSANFGGRRLLNITKAKRLAAHFHTHTSMENMCSRFNARVVFERDVRLCTWEEAARTIPIETGLRTRPEYEDIFRRAGAYVEQAEMGRYCYANGLPEPAHADLVAAREEYRRVRRERESVPPPHDRDSASAEASTAVEGAGVSPRDEAYGWPHGAPPYPGVPLHSGARAPPVFTAAAGPPAADDGATAAGGGATAAAIPPPTSVGGGALSSADDGAVACTHPPPEAHGWPHCAPPYPGAPMYSGTRAPPGSAAVAVPVATGDGATAAALPPQSLVKGGAASSTGNGAVASVSYTHLRAHET